MTNKMREAVEKGDVDAVRHILAAGYPIDTQNARHRDRALHVAARIGNEVICCMLLDAGFDVDGCDGDGETPLHLAATYGHASVCALLIEAGANIDVSNDRGESPLDIASDYARTEACRVLIANGADVHEMKSSEAFEVIFPEGYASPNFTPSYATSRYLTPLQLAIRHGRDHYVRQAAEANQIDIAQVTLGGKSLLELATGHKAVLAILHAMKTQREVEQSLEIGSAPAPEHGGVKRKDFGML